jgi:hypothetical protein
VGAGYALSQIQAVGVLKMLFEEDTISVSANAKENRLIAEIGTWLNTKITKLPVNIFVDSIDAWHRYGNKRYIKFQNNILETPNPAKALPLSIETNPQVLEKNAKSEITNDHLNSLKMFVKSNKDILNSLAKYKIGIFEFLDKMATKISIEENAKENIRITEMTVLRKEETGLPVAIWLDDGATFLNTGHAKRIKFQSDKSGHPVSTNMVSMSIDDDPQVLVDQKLELKSKEVEMIKAFVKINKEPLLDLSDKKITIDVFRQRMQRV